MADLDRQVGEINFWIVTKQHGALDDIAELSDIARPVVSHECFKCARCDPGESFHPFADYSYK